jgi:outer membrane protein TolC
MTESHYSSAKKHIPLFALCVVLFAAACRTPETDILTSGQAEQELGDTLTWQERQTADELPLDSWWREFANKELKELLQRSNAGNIALKEALLRVQQARELQIQASSSSKLQLGYSAGAEVNERSNRSSQKGGEAYNARLQASYEVDLWDRLQARIKAADEELEVRRADEQALRITISAELSSRWLNAVGEKQFQQLLQAQIQRTEKVLEIIKLRFLRNKAGLLDVNRQERDLENLKARLPLSELNSARLDNEVAFLIGLEPAAFDGVQSLQLPPLPALPAKGTAAELLRRRPDIRAAGHRLNQAGWNVRSAEAELYPQLKLSADAEQVFDFFDGPQNGTFVTFPALLGQQSAQANFRVAGRQRS